MSDAYGLAYLFGVVAIMLTLLTVYLVLVHIIPMRRMLLLHKRRCDENQWVVQTGDVVTVVCPCGQHAATVAIAPKPRSLRSVTKWRRDMASGG